MLIFVTNSIPTLYYSEPTSYFDLSFSSKFAYLWMDTKQDILIEKMKYILSQKAKPKIHKRHLNISTHFYDEEHIIVTGELKEERLIPTYGYIIGKFDPGIFHHMLIYMLVEIPTLTIKDIQVEMPGTPHEKCREMVNSIAGIKGLRIKRGFTLKVRRMAGGRRGCIHLTTLLLAMVPAVVQGYWVYDTRKPPENIDSPHVNMNQYLIDTCWMWRRGGSLAEQFKKATGQKS